MLFWSNMVVVTFEFNVANSAKYMFLNRLWLRNLFQRSLSQSFSELSGIRFIKFCLVMIVLRSFIVIEKDCDHSRRYLSYFNHVLWNCSSVLRVHFKLMRIRLHNLVLLMNFCDNKAEFSIWAWIHMLVPCFCSNFIFIICSDKILTCNESIFELFQ
jgi:hypothetical protein